MNLDDITIGELYELKGGASVGRVTNIGEPHPRTIEVEMVYPYAGRRPRYYAPDGLIRRVTEAELAELEKGLPKIRPQKPEK